MRKLAANDFVERALKVVQGRARIKRTMWSRRAQEYDAKINSGDLISIAEVVRDLYRADNQPEQSLFGNASSMRRHLIAWRVKSRPSTSCRKPKRFASSESNLNKGPKRGKSNDDDAAGDGDAQEAAA